MSTNLLLAICLTACGVGGDSALDSAAPLDTAPPSLEPVFTFAVLADPHIAGSSENEERLQAAVTWLNDNSPELRLELVLVVGDIGWGGHTERAYELLEELEPAWVPMIGDNEIQTGGEEEFGEVFGRRYGELEGALEGWTRATGPVANPEWGVESWFYNLAFTHKGVRFIGLDWCTRRIESIYGEMADLHDFEGGTWPWFTGEVAAWEGLPGSVVMFSHHPMHMSPGAFDMEEWDQLSAFTAAYADMLSAAFAGHYHMDMEYFPEDSGYDVYAVDATWDDEVTLRLVEAWSDGAALHWEHTLVRIPWSP